MWFRPSAQPPLTVELAFWLSVAQTGASLVAPREPNGLPLISTVAFIVVINAIALWIAWRSRSGAHWARILRTIGAALSVWSVLGSAVAIMTPYSTVGEAIISALLAAVDIAAVVLLWRPASNAYFRAVGAEKRQFREAMLR
jgi:hypothetical protein